MRYDANLQELTFQHSGCKYRLTRMKAFYKANQLNDKSIQQVFPSPAHGLIYFRQLVQAVSIQDLRKLLGATDHFHHAQDEESIRIRIAALFLDGTLSLFEFTKHASPTGNTGSTSSLKKHKVMYDDINTDQFQSPADLFIHQQTPPRSFTKFENDIIDEQAMAEVLIVAAACGTPLCELCMEKN